MRKIILNVAVSLDGFIEDANGQYDWCFTDQDYGMTDFMNSIDAILFGRKSYELVMKEDYAAHYKNYEQYVFSTTLQELNKDNNAILVNTDALSFIQTLKTKPGKKIWLFGGANLTSFCMQHQLIDELMLSVHPVLLGSGKPLFENLAKRTSLQLTNAVTFSSGLVQLYYDIPGVG